MSQDLKSLLLKPLTALEEISVAFKCTPDTTLSAAIETLQGAKIGCLVVAEGNQVLGIITERDILMKVTGNALSPGKETVATFMTPNPVTVSKSSPIGEAMRLMLTHNFRHLVVADASSSVIQIISIKDLLKYVVTSLDAHILQSPPDLWKD